MLLMLIGTMFPILASSATHGVMTLREAVLLSIRYNPNIQSADLQRVVDKYNLRLAQFQFEIQYALAGTATYSSSVANGTKAESDAYNLIPSANLTGPYGTTVQTTIGNPVTHTAGSARFYNPVATVAITQPLMRGYGPDVTLIPLYNAEDTELVNRLSFKNTAIVQITGVINQYIATVQAANTLKAQIASLKQVENDLKQAKLLVQAGKRGSADLVQFEANASAQRLTLEQQQVALQQAKAQLLLLIGIEPTANINVTDTVPQIIKKLPTLKKSTQIALSNNVTYQQALINIRLLKRNVTLAQDNIRPQLDLSVSQTQGGGTGGLPNGGPESLVNGTNYGTTVGLTLNVPISTLPQEQSIASAKIALRQAQVNLAALKRQTILSVQVAYQTLVSQKQQVEQAWNAVQLAQENYNISKIKLQYGKTTAFEVSTLQTSLTTAMINYVNTFASYITSQANFDSILGITTDRWNLEVKY